MSKTVQSQNRLEELRREVFTEAKFLRELTATIEQTETELGRAKEIQEQTAFSMRQKTAAICAHIERQNKYQMRKAGLNL